MSTQAPGHADVLRCLTSALVALGHLRSVELLVTAELDGSRAVDWSDETEADVVAFLRKAAELRPRLVAEHLVFERLADGDSGDDIEVLLCELVELARVPDPQSMWLAMFDELVSVSDVGVPLMRMLDAWAPSRAGEAKIWESIAGDGATGAG